MKEHVICWDLSAAHRDERPPHSVNSRNNRMWDFLSIDANGLFDLDLLASDRNDGLDQGRISGVADSAMEITAPARFVDERRTRQAHEHHVANSGIPVKRQDPP